MTFTGLGLSACIAQPPVTRSVTYSVTTDGSVVSDVNELAQVAAEAYASVQGWRGAGIEFTRVDTGVDRFARWLPQDGDQPRDRSLARPRARQLPGARRARSRDAAAVDRPAGLPTQLVAAGE